ncbi:CoA-transferase family III [Burkholderia sp. D7]|nr:CoA-transferase family III [Burkholderia sp. D7]
MNDMSETLGHLDLEGRVKAALDNPMTDGQSIDPMRELTAVLSVVGLDPSSAGGSTTFIGSDPIISSPLALATAGGVALMAKAVAVGDLWRFRGGESQDLSVNLGQVPLRLSPFHDKKWELLNGYAPGNPADPDSPFWPTNMYRTADDRWVQLINVYPRTRKTALAFFDCHDDRRALADAVRKWNGVELEDAASRAGVQATMLRTFDEFARVPQFQYIKDTPLIQIEKIGESDPEPFTSNPEHPLSGVRALGLGHVIAGAGLGRALAYHGADVLNVWDPSDFEIDALYATANVGLRSTMMDLGRADELQRFKDLVKDSDIFFANRRPGYLDKRGLSAQNLADIRPGMIHVDISIYGPRGPWANRVGFDQTASGVVGAFALEGSPDNPQLPKMFAVNDYITSWMASIGVIAALKRRAVEGGSYRIRVSMARLAIWLLQLGVFGKQYAASIAGTAGGHELLPPELFEADTPLGHYQGVTDQVQMSKTPGRFKFPLVPRASGEAVWLPR